DITTAISGGVGYDPGGMNNTALGWGNSGLHVYVAFGNSAILARYTMSTAYDMVDVHNQVGLDFTQTTSSGALNLDGNCLGIAFEADGKTMYILDDGGLKIRFYSLVTAWDFRTATATGEYITVPANSRCLDYQNGIFYVADGASSGWMYAFS
ncbi:MAG: hypothetical protein V3S69_07270, partial [Dehalococcoidales bacterium]